MATIRRRPCGAAPNSRIGPTATSMLQTCFSSGVIPNLTSSDPWFLAIIQAKLHSRITLHLHGSLKPGKLRCERLELQQHVYCVLLENERRGPRVEPVKRLPSL